MTTEPITDEELDDLVDLHKANHNQGGLTGSYARLLHESLPRILRRLKAAEEKRDEWRQSWKVESGEEEEA
jgi:hypothetical protein